jgi:hypothetical protein
VRTRRWCGKGKQYVEVNSEGAKSMQGVEREAEERIGEVVRGEP